MPATPARIAKSTVDGVVVERIDTSIKATHVNAVDLDERETFFDAAADAEAMLGELWIWRKDPSRLREAVEFGGGAIDLGTIVSLTPAAPQFRVVDETRAVDAVGAVRSYAPNYETERYAIELIGIGLAELGDPLTIAGNPPTNAEQGGAYSFIPTTGGGVQPYVYSLEAPNGVPSGLTFSTATGELSGSPLGGPAGVLDIDGTPDLVARVGEPWSFMPVTTGGVPFYSFEIVAPNGVPPGVLFNPATGGLAGQPEE